MRKRKVSIKSILFLVIGILFVSLSIFFPIILSADLLDNWHLRNALTQGKGLFAITYGNNTFVAVGGLGTILSSADGITWNSRSSGATNALNAITYGNNTFIVVEIDGTIFQSDIVVIRNNPPAVITLTATAIKATIATLNGNINPGGLSTTYYFEYGLTTDYGNTTDVLSAGSGSEEVAVNANLTDLIAEFTYHYQLVATNSAGTTEGLDQTFSTLHANVGSISGRAAINIAGHNDLSVANAVVSLQGTSYTTTTDSNGNFT